MIYAELTGEAGGQAGIDVFQLINQGFGTSLPAGALVVQDAGFFTFGQQGNTSKGSAGVTLQQWFPNSPVPAAVASTSAPVQQTSSFWLTVNLNNIDLFNSLLQIGVTQENGSAGNVLSLSGTYTSGAPASQAITTTDYCINLPSTRLFDLFQFDGVQVIYNFSKSSSLAVSGSLSVSLFNSIYTFTGQLISDGTEKTVRATVSCSDISAQLPSLFGGDMVGISFSGLQFDFYYPWGAPKGAAAAQFMVTGTVAFNSFQFAGLLWLNGTSPQIASVVMDQQVSIADVFAQCIPGASWPSGLIDLTFKPSSQIYYSSQTSPLTLLLSNDGAPSFLPPPPASAGAPAPATGQQVVYLPGFNLSAAFDLTLLDAIHVEGTVVLNKTGVTASIALQESINIYVLTIAGTGGQGGPTLSFTTATSPNAAGQAGSSGSMGFAGSLIFFQQNFGLNVNVNAFKNGKGNLEVNATLSPSQDWPPLLTKSDQLQFSYSADKGFVIDDWPAVNYVGQIIDMLEELKKLSAAKGSGCGALVDFAFKELLGQSFKINLSFSTGSGLSLNVNGTYTLSFSGANFATLSFPQILAIPLPSNLNLDDLWSTICTALQGAGQSFIEGVLNNQEAIAQLLALTAGTAAAQYAATLACQSLVDGAVEAAVAAGADALASAGGAAALGAAAAGAALGAISATLSGSDGDNPPKPGEPPNAPTHLSVQPNADRSVNVAWWVSSGAQRYEATLLGPQGQTLQSIGNLDYAGNACVFAAPALPLPAACTVSVVAFNAQGAASPAATLGLTYLASPTGLQVAPAASEAASAVAVALQWQAVADATGYGVNVSGAKTQALTSAMPQAVLDIGPADPAGAYTLTVTAQGGAQAVPSPASAPLTLTRLAAPGTLAVAPAASVAGPEAGIALSWQAVPQATQYAITLGGGRTQTLLSATPDTVLSFAPADPAGGYEVTVVAQGGAQTIASAPSPVLSLTRLAVPTGLTATVDASLQPPLAGVTLAWETVGGAVQYGIGISGAKTQTLSSTTPQLALSLAPTDPAGSYAVTVTAQGGAQSIPSAASAPLVLTRLAAPTLTATLGSAAIDVAWAPVPGAAGYRLSWQAPGGATGEQTVPGPAPASPPAGQAAQVTSTIALPTPPLPGAWTLTAQALPPANQATVIASAAGAPVVVTVTAGATPAELATSCHAQQMDGSDCGRRLLQAFPTLSYDDLAVAMAQGGYAAADTGAGLSAAFPAIPMSAMASALAVAYPAQTPAAVATSCHGQGLGGADCGRQLIQAFPALSYDDLATAMAQGGYAAADTGSGLSAAFPSIPMTAMAQALAKAYP